MERRSARNPFESRPRVQGPMARVPRSLLLALCALALSTFSGCAGDGGGVDNGPGGQSAAGGGSLAYNGASDGSHTETVESDGSCTLHVSANLGSGSVK